MSEEQDIVARERDIIDGETGELEHVDEIWKRVSSRRAFYKMYLTDFLAVLGFMDSRQIDVFIYIAEHTNASNNIFLGSQRKIAEAVGCSKTTVNTMMQKLQEHNFIKKVQDGVYFVNPNILMKGNDNKRQMLITWELNDFDDEKAKKAIAEHRKSEMDGQVGMYRGMREPIGSVLEAAAPSDASGPVAGIGGGADDGADA